MRRCAWPSRTRCVATMQYNSPRYRLFRHTTETDVKVIFRGQFAAMRLAITSFGGSFLILNRRSAIRIFLAVLFLICGICKYASPIGWAQAPSGMAGNLNLIVRDSLTGY